MVKTVLLCFIHGFKGDEETFFHFPEKLRSLVAEKEPDLSVKVAVYPKYETRGDLAGCVEIFKEWLQDQVTDLERSAGTQQAILNPSVSVILVAHSVGGLVAADTLFSVLDSRPVSPDPNIKLMFPLVQGVMAFDTPFNGLSRSMFAYGAFSQAQNISSIWTTSTSVASLLSGGGAAAASKQIAGNQSPSWKRWQLLASRTGTYGAIIAGGVAAYVNRAEIAESLSKVNKETISQSWSKVNRENLYAGLSQVPAYVSRDSIGEGFTWIASHLKFVGALMKPAQLKTRLERLSHLKGIGTVNIYTSLGENGYWTGGYFFPRRTFCAIPAEPDVLRMFQEQPNTKASNEIVAHCSMFRPDTNPKYEEMTEAAKDKIVEWLKIDPREVSDEYQPSQGQRERSMSEAQLWDDDGKMLGNNAGKSGTDEDELQLQAILTAQGMPESKDGGISDEDLKKAAELPLPAEELDEDTKKLLSEGDPQTWKSRISNPFNRISIPGRPSIPTMPSMPSMPSFHIPGFSKKNEGDTVPKEGEETSKPELVENKVEDEIPRQEIPKEGVEDTKEEKASDASHVEKEPSSAPGE